MNPYRLLCCGWLLVNVGLAGAATGVSLGEHGVNINAGAMGQFTLEAPVLVTKDNKEEKPVATKADGSVTYAYASGATLTFSGPQDGRVSLKFNKTAGAKSFKFIMYVPMKFHQGGRYAFDGQWKEIPQAQGPQFLQQGSLKSFALSDPMGESFSLDMPAGGWMGLQDNRVFNWPIYVLAWHWDLWGRTEGADVLTVKFGESPKERKFLVDRYGQSARKDFPGKVTEDAQLKADAALPAPGPLSGVSLDSFGGLAGSGAELGLKKTGFFHAEQTKGRWVLVTPEGNAFFQLGVCGVTNCDDYTKVSGREQVYEWLPKAGDEFDTAWRERHPDWGFLSFQITNWIRKYGKPYDYNEWMGQTAARFRAWGLNSLGAFSDYTAAMRKANMPHTPFVPDGRGFGAKALPDRVGAGELIDPFVPETAAALDAAFAKAVAPRAQDPLIIGYFLGNEQHFETLPTLVPTYTSKVAAKRELARMLREQYGDVAKFNAAWRPAKPFASLDELADAPLFVRTDAAAADMQRFFAHFLDTYYSLINTAFRKHDPNHLLIGSRWTPATASNEHVVRAGGKYLDVVSVNYYTYEVEKDFLRRVTEWSGRPVILSEWYYSCNDHGLGTGKEVATQQERGAAYRNYVEQSAALPGVVGSQWFIYTDQAITGRFFEGFNGEGNNTGFVDVTDRPYAELVAAAQETHRRIYDVMLGKSAPFAFNDPRFTGSGAGARKVVSIPRALPGMKLDGTTTNWPGRPAEPVEPSRLVLGKANPQLRGDYRLCWDDEYLYFHIQVADATPLLNNHNSGNLWSGDAVELFIGGKNLDAGGSLQYSDRQVLLGASPEPKLAVAGTGNEELAKLCRSLTVKNVAGDGYVLQAALPWKALNITPSAGAEFLFDLAIDYSDNGDGRSHQLVWNGTAGNSGDRGKWGRARLVEN